MSTEDTAVTEADVAVRSDRDILLARQKARELSSSLGFSTSETTILVTVVSELARNLVVYAGSGRIRLAVVTDGRRQGLLVESIDRGPGIADVDAALMDGYSTSGGLGLGLPGAKRLMDDFEIHSAPGEGTTVRATKWARPA